MTWNQVEEDFLRSMSEFDTGIAGQPDGIPPPDRTTLLSAAIQNGKGDWFNNVAALLLENCAGIGNAQALQQSEREAGGKSRVRGHKQAREGARVQVDRPQR
jgi:hypothetical protein